MSEILLHEPYVVPRKQKRVVGVFRAAPDFRLRGGNLPNGATAFGLITVPEGHSGVTIEAEIRGAPHLDVNSTDWTLRDVRGIHAFRTHCITIRGTMIEDVPSEAVLVSGVTGLTIEHLHARRCISAINVHYFNAYVAGMKPMANKDIQIRRVTFRDGRLPKRDEWNRSLLDPRYDVSGAAVYVAAAEDCEITDVVSTGETGGTVKTVDGRRVRIAYCTGPSLMVQGSCYWDAERGPHSIDGNGNQLPWPLGPGSFAKDITVEANHIHHRLTLAKAGAGNNAIQLSWPQEGTKVLNNHLWWKQGSYPTQNSCLQLADGVQAEVKGNVFHKVDRTVAEPIDHPLNMHHGIWNAEATHGDSAPAKWPSRIMNQNWREVNQWTLE